MQKEDYRYIRDMDESEDFSHLKKIPVEVEKVLELEGVIRPDFTSSIYAHISKPIKDNDRDVQYTLMAIFPQHGIMHLGSINPETRRFEHYDPDMINFALYTRADNHVVKTILVPLDQLDKLQVIDDVLKIEGISVKRELIPLE